MSSRVVISAASVSKFYNVYEQPVDRLKQMLCRGRKCFFTPVAAVRGISLEIRAGETFGIVGRNGSGKSTLLQLICGTLAPSMGEITVRGKVAALLELGAGFNPEFTGRENVFLSGAIMGLSDDDMHRRFDSIVGFADIGGFIDQPVKNYSSGMFARLAFAVAISVDADILVIDEALSVGDEAFQRKCFARIEAMKEAGCTILFVSHSAGAVVDLCDRALLMDAGECLMIGQPKQVVESYQRLIFSPPEAASELRRTMLKGAAAPEPAVQSENPASGATDGLPYKHISGSARLDPELSSKSAVEYPDRGCRIEDVGIYDRHGRKVNVLLMGEGYHYRYRVQFTATQRWVRFGMMIKTLTGREIGGIVSHPEGLGIELIERGQEVDVQFEFVSRMAQGAYFANAGVVGRQANGEEAYLHRIIDVMMFRVEPVSRSRITGPVDLSGGDVASLTVRGAMTAGM